MAGWLGDKPGAIGGRLPSLMIISSRQQLEKVDDEDTLAALLALRDSRGGGEFWVADAPGSFPCLAVVVSGGLSHVTYFPAERHPGYRALGNLDGAGPAGEFATLVWEGCDPASGEQVPWRFVLPFETALTIARDFFRNRSRSGSIEWLEL